MVEGQAKTESFVLVENPVSKDTIEVLDITSLTYTGKLMIIHDSFRVKVASIDVFEPDVKGLAGGGFGRKIQRRGRGQRRGIPGYQRRRQGGTAPGPDHTGR